MGRRGALGRSTGRVALYFREDAPVLGPPPGASAAPAEPAHEAIRERLRGGACFFTDLLVDVEGLTTEELQEALWDLVWAGEATNDAFAPLRSPKLAAATPWSQRARAERAGRRRFSSRRTGAQAQVRAAGRSPTACSRPATATPSPAAARRPSCCSSATGS